MQKTYSKRLLSALIITVLVLSFALPVHAADYVEIIQNTNVYQSASSSSFILGSLKKGAIAETTGTTGQWVKVVYNGGAGYVLNSNTKTSDGTPSTQSTGTSQSANMYATAAVNVRSGPGTSYSVIGGLSKNDTVVCTGSESNWYKINWNGSTAYVHASYLKALSASDGSTVMATVPVNVRSGPGTKYSIVGALNKNQTVTKLGTSGKWTKVNYNGSTAYVHSAYLTAATAAANTPTATATPTPTPTSDESNRLYAKTTTAIRNGPGTGYNKIGELSPNDYIEYEGTTSGSWYKVVFGSYNAYVYAYDVEFRSASTISQNESLYATTTTPVYSSPSNSSSILGYLYSGDQVYSYGGSSGSYYGVWFNGRQGYVLSSNLQYGSTGFTNYNYVGAYWYSVTNGARCYSAASTSSTYLGYLNYGESVWVKYANSSWAECTINGKTMYVAVGDLSSNSYYGTNYQTSNFTSTRAISYYNSQTGGAIAGTIPAGTYIYVVSAVDSNGFVRIQWQDSTKTNTYSAYAYYTTLL